MNKEFFKDGYRWVHSKDEMPTEPHFAVMEFGTIYIPGDERSRTNPGHGYPASTESKIDYIVFKDQASWEAYIKLNKHRNFVPIHTTPAAILTETKVSIKLG